MRISDWSSDVCSSDLRERGEAATRDGHSRAVEVGFGVLGAHAGSPWGRSEKSRKTTQLHSRLHISSRDRDRTKREANPAIQSRTAVFVASILPVAKP